MLDVAGPVNHYRPQKEGQPSDTSLPDELSYFYARFKSNNTETCMRAPAVLEDSAADVSKTFIQVNIHKAAGPD